MAPSWIKLLLVGAFFTASLACPERCLCKWKNGKQTVDCSKRGFLSIPQGIDPNTQVLEFSDNTVDVLPDALFFKMDLINLQKIFLPRCGIMKIIDGAFLGLTNLVELDLSHNGIGEITPGTFADCPSLMRLSLVSNPLKSLEALSFQKLSFLTTLELSSCEISRIEERAFDGLSSIERLYLDGNMLTSLKAATVLPKSLKGIQLQENPWECDCHIRELHAWLLAFAVPRDVEPICKGPSHLSRATIVSLSPSEMACLPNISPTSFYLELGEEKNVSLICQVQATPAANVSWWFQGQMLRNDTAVAPGVHLVYFVEEGTNNKRSELFIFNTNTNDNGTFVCNAENTAGSVETNFTIRIVVKEEPVPIVSFSFEHLMVAVAAAVASTLLIVIIVVISIINCRRNRKRKTKRNQAKELTTHYQQNVTKCVSEETPAQIKSEDPVEIQHQEQMLLYAANSKELLRAITPFTPANQVRSPSSLKRYQLEQNPDLINDTESVGRRREGDGEDEQLAQTIETVINPIVQQNLLQFPVTCLRSEFYNPEGYPIDYGLPKILRPVNENFYRTLPYRISKRHSASAKLNCYQREAEFLAPRPQIAVYEHYCQDVRYTADGYPVRTTAVTDTPPPSSLPCCSSQQTCVPADLHLINPEYAAQSKFVSLNKRCVGAQTESKQEEKQKEEVVDGERAVDALTESPDEGYEGETSVV